MIRRWLPAALLAAAVAACGSVPAPANHPPASTPATARPTPTALRAVHDPGRVTGTIQGPCHARDSGRLPDPRCDPGAIDPAVTQASAATTICHPGYTATVRPPSSQTDRFKWDVAEPAYGQDHAAGELDHLVPLELGGANDASNLWVMAGPIPNAKDAVERALHKAVCGGEVPLGAAQEALAFNWTTAEQQLGIAP